MSVVLTCFDSDHRPVLKASPFEQIFSAASWLLMLELVGSCIQSNSDIRWRSASSRKNQHSSLTTATRWNNNTRWNLVWIDLSLIYLVLIVYLIASKISKYRNVSTSLDMCLVSVMCNCAHTMSAYIPWRGWSSWGTEQRLYLRIGSNSGIWILINLGRVPGMEVAP